MTGMLTRRQRWNRFCQWLFGPHAIVLDCNGVSMAAYLIDYEDIYGKLPDDRRLRANPLRRSRLWRSFGHHLWNPWASKTGRASGTSMGRTHGGEGGLLSEGAR